ncbi:MAG: M20/M25/M40 family metallo-hydrolase [Acholeplasmataceae bacterium]|jgi:Iap family predicted aminopeptidase|nr:M20/M25/M40 family metallo-hydrolase [Acholeplasmataceae bacterium]
MMKNYNSFDLIEKISFERIGGSKEELKAAKIIQEELKKKDLDSKLEAFEVDYYQIETAKLEVLEPFKETISVTGYGMSGNTPKEGITADLVYIENGVAANLVDLKDKIVLVNGRMPYALYKKLVENEVKGFISVSGSVYDDYTNTDLDQWSLRLPHYKHGKIPGVTMRIKTAQELLRKQASKVRLTLTQKESKRNSHNVVTKIKGTTYPNKVIGVTAHYDSVVFSSGAFDNATGSATILELINYFKEHPPKRTLKFIWCGSEEMGLLGAKAYVEAHKEELEAFEFVVNVDMTGVVLGYDIAVCTTEKSFIDYLDYYAKEVGFPIRVRQGVYSSDSTPFADAGVPAMSFARLAPRGGAEIHSRKDLIDFLDEKAYYKTCKFIIDFTEKIANSVVMPIPRTIPDNMKEELDYYNVRKERPQK